jgi:hypothetical protein
MKPDSEDEAEIKRLKGYVMQLEAEVRTLKHDIDFLKAGHLEVVGKRISKLTNENAELKKSPPLPFDPTPFLIDGNHLKDGS